MKHRGFVAVMAIITLAGLAAIGAIAWQAVHMGLPPAGARRPPAPRKNLNLTIALPEDLLGRRLDAHGDVDAWRVTRKAQTSVEGLWPNDDGSYEVIVTLRDADGDLGAHGLLRLHYQPVFLGDHAGGGHRHYLKRVEALCVKTTWGWRKKKED